VRKLGGSSPAMLKHKASSPTTKWGDDPWRLVAANCGSSILQGRIVLLLTRDRI
jgi:hypothetical protein